MTQTLARHAPVDAPGSTGPTGSSSRARPSGSRRPRGPQLLAYLALGVLSLVFVVPWVWLVSTSLKSPQELAAWPPTWVPETLRFDNYAEVFRQVPFLQYLRNTTVVTVFSVVGAVLSNTLVAYGFACLRWPGRDVAFGLVMATLILPAFVTFIPLYSVYAQLGWIDTYLPLIVPTFLGNAFFIFLLRQFFRRVPSSYFDAARIDGASEVRIFLRIALPLVGPAVTVVALLQFVASWNDYFGPLVFLTDDSKYTVALGIASMQSTYGFSNFSWIMAATAMSIVPVVVLFFLAQRVFIQGASMSGLKG